MALQEYQNRYTGQREWAKRATTAGAAMGNKRWNAGDWLLYSPAGWLETVLTPEEFADTFVQGAE